MHHSGANHLLTGLFPEVYAMNCFLCLQETETCWRVPDPTSFFLTAPARVTNGWRALTRESGSHSQVQKPAPKTNTSSHLVQVISSIPDYGPILSSVFERLHTCRRLWSESGGDCVVRAALRHAPGPSGGWAVCHVHTGARDARSGPVPPARSGHFGERAAASFWCRREAVLW